MTPVQQLSTHRLSYSQDDSSREAFLEGDAFLDEHEKLRCSRERPSQLRYLSLPFRLIIHVLAIWGLASLGLQLASPIHNGKSHTCKSPAFLTPTSLYAQETKTELDGYHPALLPPGLNTCDCGSSIHEAKARNCTYDPLATAWLPPYCRDEQLTAEFEKSGPGPNGTWGYFADKEGKVPLNKVQLGELADHNGTFWASHNWHVSHCLFYWQKYTRMRKTKIIIEERFDSLHHVKHCMKLIQKPVPDYFFLIEVPVTLTSGEDSF